MAIRHLAFHGMFFLRFLLENEEPRLLENEEPRSIKLPLEKKTEKTPWRQFFKWKVIWITLYSKSDPTPNRHSN